MVKACADQMFGTIMGGECSWLVWPADHHPPCLGVIRAASSLRQQLQTACHLRHPTHSPCCSPILLLLSYASTAATWPPTQEVNAPSSCSQHLWGHHHQQQHHHKDQTTCLKQQSTHGPVIKL